MTYEQKLAVLSMVEVNGSIIASQVASKIFGWGLRESLKRVGDLSETHTLVYGHVFCLMPDGTIRQETGDGVQGLKKDTIRLRIAEGFATGFADRVIEKLNKKFDLGW